MKGINMSSNKNYATWMALLLPIIGAACGGGTSTAEMLLMDAPPSGVTSVKLWVGAMQVHVAADDGEDKDASAAAVEEDSSIDDDDRWLSLSVDRSIDLVQHQGETAAEVLGQLSLPEGKITQIRLVIDTTKPNTVTFNGVDCDLDTSRVAKKGVKIDHPFKAFRSDSGAKHEIFVDLKLDESLTSSGLCFELEPVIKLYKVKTNGAEVTVKL